MITENQKLFANLNDFNLTEENYVEKIEEFVSGLSGVLKYFPLNLTLTKEKKRDAISELGLFLASISEKDYEDFKIMMILAEIDFNQTLISVTEQFQNNPNSEYEEVTLIDFKKGLRVKRCNGYYTRTYCFYRTLSTNTFDMNFEREFNVSCKLRFGKEISDPVHSILMIYGKIMTKLLPKILRNIKSVDVNLGLCQNLAFNPIILNYRFTDFINSYYIYWQMSTNSKLNLNNLYSFNAGMRDYTRDVLEENPTHIDVYNDHMNNLEGIVKKYGLEKEYKKAVLEYSLKN